MTLIEKFVIRTVSVLIVSYLATWQVADQDGWRSLLVAAIVAAADKLIEIVGPGSDVGIKWTKS